MTVKTKEKRFEAAKLNVAGPAMHVTCIHFVKNYTVRKLWQINVHQWCPLAKLVKINSKQGDLVRLHIDISSSILFVVLSTNTNILLKDCETHSPPAGAILLPELLCMV